MLKIYKASAGSGKTYTLAYEYIRDLLGVKIPGTERYCLNSPKYNKGYGPTTNRHRYILAITFTNKATEEMKRRIIDKLDALSRPPQAGAKDADYAKELCGLFGCTRQELADAAQRSLKELLSYYSFFNVATIDSFFQRVLRTFARELDRQGDFNIEISDTMAVQTAIDTMLNEFNRSSDLTSPLGRWIFTYISTEFESGNKTNMFNRRSSLYAALLRILKRVCDETFKPHELKMLEYLEDKGDDGAAAPPQGTQEPKFTHKRVDATIKALQGARDSILQTVSQRVSDVMAELQRAGVDLSQLSQRLAIAKLIPDNFIVGKKVSASVFESKTYKSYVNDRKDPFTKRFKGTQEHVDIFLDMLTEVRDLYYDYYGMDTLIASVRELGLLAYAWQYLKEFSALNNTVLLSDTNQILSRIIGRDPTPFIYERMGVTLNHFLIDEFQDTSKMQWENLKPLVDNSLGEDHDNLIIGDEKQSIYRFRNSDSSLLRTTVQDHDFPAPQYRTQVCGSGKADNTNWRSASDVVKFNNTLFTNMAGTLHAEGFENVVQAIAPKNKDRRGYVEFVAIDAQKGAGASEADDAAEQSADTDKATSGEMMQASIRAMAQRMLHQHTVRGYEWRDMVVLVSTNDEGAEVVETLLSKYPDIPVLSEESLYLKKSPAVQLIVDVLRMIVTPESVTAERTGMTGADVARVISRIEYFRAQGADMAEALDKSLDSASGAENLRVGIDAIKARKPASLISMVESIILEQISPQERQSQIAYLTAFLDYVADYSSKFNPTLTSFLSHWDTVGDKLSISSASDIDAVKVMTIHKSKGLEFECVHIPFAWWELIGSFRGQWLEFPQIQGVDAKVCPPVVYMEMNKYFAHKGSFFEKQFAEDSYKNMIDTMNKTYVAFTRASSQLIVYYNKEKGIGTDIAAAMEAGYKGTNECMADLSKYYDAATGAFVMGEDCPKKSDNPEAKAKAEEGNAPVVLEEYPVYYTDGAEMITCVADVLDFTPDTDPIDDEEDLAIENYAPEGDDGARLRGIRLHDALSRIEEFDDMERAVGESAQYMRLTDEERAELHATLTEILNRDDRVLRRWFEENERVMCEQSIYIPSTGRTRRLDRVVVYADGSVDIIDYKFTSETDKSHHRQVRSYMRLLQSIGYRRVRGYLWYPMKKQVVEVESAKCEM